jgi:hypothetical protein
MVARVSTKGAALLALYDLGGARRAIDTEDIAMRAAEIAPRAFRWKKYPEQINLEAVRLALKHNVEETPSRIVGGILKGWQLTAHGLKECERLRGVESDNTRPAQIRASAAFRAWRDRGPDAVSRALLLELLRTNDYFPESKRRQRAIALLNYAGSGDDLSAFFSEMTSRFPEDLRT